jgi:hypothetical protein
LIDNLHLHLEEKPVAQPDAPVQKYRPQAPANSPIPIPCNVAFAYNDASLNPAIAVSKASPRPRETRSDGVLPHTHDVTALPAWQALNQHRQAMQDFSMREAFAADPSASTNSP